MSWGQFLKLHWEVLAATDFFKVEVAMWHGLATYCVLLVMEFSTRRVHITGIAPYPIDAFITQCARQLTDPVDGFLLGKRYLLHDRDEKFVHRFDSMLRASGVEPVVLPARSPNLNACCEGLVRSIREEALHQMIVIGEASIRYVIQSYLTHYHHERNHQGLYNQLITPEPGIGSQSGQVMHRDPLAGLRTYYYREAADATQFFNLTSSRPISNTIRASFPTMESCGAMASGSPRHSSSQRSIRSSANGW
jgi:putative transposase